ncbi:SH3 domain-containing protein [Pedobacter sp. JCM 36344]|uniref:SH3 domain-containing protein n=1 Tax=Pedobacter sp. JCM 36344 TaxID=3374280 RepID=UPI00397E141F
MHRRNLILLIALLTLPFCSNAAEPVDLLFAKANREYTQKNYEAAANTYQQVLAAGVKTAAVYYNLGNAHYRLNSIAAAILNYERAHRLSPNDKDINANLAFANSKLTDKMEVVPELFLKRWWTSFLLLLTVQNWSVLAVVFLLLGFAGVIIYLFSHEYEWKRLSFYSGFLLIFVGICFIAFASAEDNYLQTQKEAVVFNGKVNVKSAASAKQKTLIVIHEGTKVRIIELKEDWLKVELPNGNIGWVESGALQLI